ncbi:hypothetical protein AB7M47_005383 [Bradyrhizobium elkanii]
MDEPRNGVRSVHRQKQREAVRPNVDPERGWGKWLPGADCAGRRNEGVGEHVRTRFQLGILAGEIAEPSGLRTERRNLCFFCRTGFGKVALSEIRSSRLT